MPLLHTTAGVAYIDGVRAETPESWQASCDLCGYEGRVCLELASAALGFHSVGDDEFVCVECSTQLSGRGEAPLPPQDRDPTEQALIESLRSHWPEGELNLTPGSLLGCLITTAAVCINRLQFQSAQDAEAQIRRVFQESGLPLDGDTRSPDDDTVAFLASQAMQAQNQSREELIRAAATTNGRVGLAQTMAMPLWRRNDQQELARRLMPIEQLPTGALPVYDALPPQQLPVSPEPPVETRWARLIREGDPFE